LAPGNEGNIKMKKLSVNIDHIATIREARKTFEPNPVSAAILCELAGANGITLHLREDRRHVKDADLEILRKLISTELNVEMAQSKEIIDIAKRIKPDMITLVPEKRDELTTEGGLNVKPVISKIAETVSEFKNIGIKVNLFVDPDFEQIEAAAKTKTDAIEIHTGSYANARTEKDKKNELDKIRKAARKAHDLGLDVHAGHGLTYQNIVPVANIPEIVEFAIGHSIVSRAVFVGIQQAVKDMIALLDQDR
jgi:pyridoxine 5-phosphate synthase